MIEILFIVGIALLLITFGWETGIVFSSSLLIKENSLKHKLFYMAKFTLLYCIPGVLVYFLVKAFTFEQYLNNFTASASFITAVKVVLGLGVFFIGLNLYTAQIKQPDIRKNNFASRLFPLSLSITIISIYLFNTFILTSNLVSTIIVFGILLSAFFLSTVFNIAFLRINTEKNKTITGLSLIIIGSYFLLSASIIPMIEEAFKIYSFSSQKAVYLSGEENNFSWIILSALFLLIAGFLSKFKSFLSKSE